MVNKIYKIICDYYKENGIEPSIREISKLMGFSSHNSVYYYLKKLESLNYIKHINNKWVLNKIECNGIKVINEDRYFNIEISNKERFIYKIKNNYFNDYMIKRNDYLIIEKHKMNNGDLGLFIINDDYRIMKYEYKDGFYILKDCEEEILVKINCIGKVVGLIRV